MKGARILCVTGGLFYLALASLIPTVANAQTFSLGIELAEGACGDEFDELEGTPLTISGWTTLTTSEPIGAMTQSIEIRSPDGASCCIGSEVACGESETRLAPTEDCANDCKNALLPVDVLGFVNEPTSFVIQSDMDGCGNGVGDPASSANAGRRGIVDFTLFGIGSELPAVTDQRTMPFEITITTPLRDEPPVTIEIEFVDGLQGPGLPNGNTVSFGTSTISTTPDDMGRVVTTTGCTFTVIARPGGLQRPGAFNQDSMNDLTDQRLLLAHLFLGDPELAPCFNGSSEHPSNVMLLDANGDGLVDMSDGIWNLIWLFLGGNPHILGDICVPIVDCPDDICLE